MRKALLILIASLLVLTGCNKGKSREVNDFLKAKYDKPKSQISEKEMEELKKDISEKTPETVSSNLYMSLNENKVRLLDSKGEVINEFKDEVKPDRLRGFVNEALFFLKENNLFRLKVMNNALIDEHITAVKEDKALVVADGLKNEDYYIGTVDGISKVSGTTPALILKEVGISDFAVRGNLILYKNGEGYKLFNSETGEVKVTTIGDLEGQTKIIATEKAFLIHTTFNDGVVLKVDDTGEVRNLKELNGSVFLKTSGDNAYFGKDGQVYKLDSSTMDYSFVGNGDNNGSFLKEGLIVKNGKLTLADRPMFASQGRLFLIEGGK